MIPQSRWPDAKGLWALFWRMFVIGPMILVFGMLLLILALGLTIVPPAYAIIFALSGKYVWAILCVAVWIPWLKFGGPVRRFVFEGWEHGL